MRAIPKQLSGSDPMHEQQLELWPKPVLNHFQAKFGNDLKPTLLAFKAARYFSPLKVHDVKPVAADLETLCAFPISFLNTTQVIDGLKLELPS